MYKLALSSLTPVAQGTVMSLTYLYSAPNTALVSLTMIVLALKKMLGDVTGTELDAFFFVMHVR